MTIKNETKNNDFNATIGNTVLAEVHPIEWLLHLVVKNNGNIQMPKTVFSNSWKINYIRGVYFDEEFDIKQNDESSLKWNAYVGKIRSVLESEESSTVY